MVIGAQLEPAAPSAPYNLRGGGAPIAPPRTMRSGATPPLAPNRMPNPAAGLDQQQQINADAKFNQWYGSLTPHDMVQFSPPPQGYQPGIGPRPTGMNPGIRLVRQNGAVAEDLTPRTAPELAAVQRQNARAHFDAQVLPTDPQHIAIMSQKAGMSPPVSPTSPPLAPGRTTTYTRDDKGHVLTANTTGSAMPPKLPTPPKPPDPSVVAHNEAMTKEATQRTANLVAATQPGGKDYKDPNAAPKKTAAQLAAEKKAADPGNFANDAERSGYTAYTRTWMTDNSKYKGDATNPDPGPRLSLPDWRKRESGAPAGLDPKGFGGPPATPPGGVGSGGGAMPQGTAPATATQPTQAAPTARATTVAPDYTNNNSTASAPPANGRIPPAPGQEGGENRLMVNGQEFIDLGDGTIRHAGDGRTYRVANGKIVERIQPKGLP